MRRAFITTAGVFCALAAGCAPEFYSLDKLIAVPPLTGNPQAAPDADAPSAQPADPVLRGSLSGRSDYELFDLGATTAGEEWTVTWAGSPYAATPFIVVLFDERQELIARGVIAATSEIRHVARAATEHLYVGIAPANGSNGGSFALAARRAGVRPVPAPAAQVVWLNFAGGIGVRVHGRAGITFPAFNAASLGDPYLGETQAIKDAIVAQMRADYAGYNVTILTSDEGPAPSTPHSQLHFGGDDSSLLGLADNVDAYNSNPTQTAVIYTDAFALYSTMKLDPQEIATMIANVASHELGHLLGLYHTRNPDDVMDTTGSAWELAEDQWFASAALESSVFPTGFENSPARLAETVGVVAAPPQVAAVAKPATRALIRKLMQEEMRYSCGTCLQLDVCSEKSPTPAPR